MSTSPFHAPPHIFKECGKKPTSPCTSSVLTCHRAIRRANDFATDEKGTGTIAGIALILVAFFILTAVGTLGGVVAGKATARTAAEQGALAAAARFDLTHDETAACDVARQIVQANGATLDSCAADGEDMRIEVSLRVSSFSVRDHARAGSLPCDEPCEDDSHSGSADASDS